MADNLIGWGARDPEGELLSIAPQATEEDAWDELETYLIDREFGGEVADDEPCPVFDGSMEHFKESALALGYRVIRVELREVFK